MDVLKEATGFLEKSSIENPRLNSEMLLAHVLGVTRVDLYLQYERPLGIDERNAFKTFLRRRVLHEPLQYILGDTEFMSVPLKVSPDVLIPRPETELLVDKVIEEVKGLGDIRILDIGTGSGNVAIALARNLPVAIMTGVDLSGKILNVAMENAEKNGVKERIQFIQADVTEDDFHQQVQGSFDIVVSNPPYVSLEEWPGLPEEIREFEPRNALCDEKDGLDFFRIIAGRSAKILTSGGKLFFEIGDGQSESVRKILQKTGYIDIQIFQDLNRIDRIVRGVLGSES